MPSTAQKPTDFDIIKVILANARVLFDVLVVNKVPQTSSWNSRTLCGVELSVITTREDDEIHARVIFDTPPDDQTQQGQKSSFITGPRDYSTDKALEALLAATEDLLHEKHEECFHQPDWLKTTFSPSRVQYSCPK